MMQTEHLYAVVDRAIETEILTLCEHHDGSAWCLFPAPVDEEFAKVAPYLVKVNDTLYDELKNIETLWGWFFESEESSKTLRKHFLTMMDVTIESDYPTDSEEEGDSEQRLFLRFYDPRILWALLDAFDLLKLNHFLGPIATVETVFPHARQSEFEQLEKLRPFGYETLQPFPLSSAQYQAVLEQCKRDLITEVAQLMKPPSEAFSQDLVTHFMSWGIAQPSQIKQLAQACIEQNISNWEKFPQQWQNQLSNTALPVNYRVNHLLNAIRKADVV